MSKNLKRMIALVLVLAVSISTFAILTAQGYSATITGWSTNIDAEYTWFANGNITDAQKEATRKAIADELKFQNEVLGFRIGTRDPDGGTVGGDGGTEWPMTTDWGNMAAVQIENRVFDITDNTGNPWGDASRVWGLVVAPFPAMAFSVKGDYAKKFPADGKNPALGNQFTAQDGSTAQVLWKSTLINNGSGITTVNRFPGSKSGSDVTNNMFRYAVAKYNQDNKTAKRDGTSYHAGYPVADAATTTDGLITYQTLMGERGTSIIAVNSQTIKEGRLEGAYVIPDTIAEAFLQLGNNYTECFAITGAPIADAKNGVQRFENGIVSGSKGFQKSSNQITAFTFGSSIPAAIDHEKGTISAYVAASSDLTKLTPEIEHNGVSISPEGEQDFSKTVRYTVTAESGDTRVYNVTVYKLADTDIASFVVGDVEAEIDRDTNTITALVDSNVDLTKAKPVVTTVGTGTTVTPASGDTVDLSGSWVRGVTYKVTKGSDTSTYTVKIRNKSTDTSIVKFNIPEGQLKYQTLYGEVVGTVSGSTVNLMYESHNSATSSVIADVELAEGATISPDPTDARSQSGMTYTVTAEDGKTQKTYTVVVTVDPSGKIGPTELELEESILGNTGFSNHDKKLALQAIEDEYNNQRTNLNYDPGVPSGPIESWDNVLPIRQFFDNGSSSQTMFGHTAAIMMDVPGGRAYTLKGQMLSLWQTGATTDDGERIDWLFRRAGGAAINEFRMEDGATYQQFSTSYGKYGNGQGMTMNGIGTVYSRQTEALKDSYYYYQPDNSLLGNIEYSFRKAYEYANMLDHNPGIALDGNFNVIQLETNTEETIKEIEKVDTKGNRTYETVKKEWPNYVMYQVFSGSGPTDSTSRNSGDKTVIIKGGNINGVDHGGAMALFGDIRTMYEALDGVKETIELREGNGGTGAVIDTFEYNVTLGTPKYYGISKDNEYVMEFASDAIELVDVTDEFGVVTQEEQVVTTEFYYTAPVDDPTNITYHEGNRFSSNNRIASASVEVEGAEVYVMNGGDWIAPEDPAGFITFPDTYPDSESEEANLYSETQIVINLPAGTGALNKDGTANEEFLSAIKFDEILLEDEMATVTYPEIAEGETDIPPVDCSAAGRITVTAENNWNRNYMILIYEDRKPVSFGAPEWGDWWIPEWHDNGVIYYLEDGTPVYGNNPNAELVGDDGQPLWIYEWFYMDGENKVILDVPNDWDPLNKENGWLVYREEHNLGVLVS